MRFSKLAVIVLVFSVGCAFAADKENLTPKKSLKESVKELKTSVATFFKDAHNNHPYKLYGSVLLLTTTIATVYFILKYKKPLMDRFGKIKRHFTDKAEGLYDWTKRNLKFKRT